MVRKEELWKQIDQLQQEKEILTLEITNANLKAEVKVYRDLYENLLRQVTGRGDASVEAIGSVAVKNSKSNGHYTTQLL